MNMQIHLVDSTVFNSGHLLHLGIMSKSISWPFVLPLSAPSKNTGVKMGYTNGHPNPGSINPTIGCGNFGNLGGHHFTR